jgi:hypothetical protein
MDEHLNGALRILNEFSDQGKNAPDLVRLLPTL